MLGRVMAEYRGQVRLIFKDFPLDSHPAARAAHEAARCAGESGKYWEYHDRLFQAQPNFGRAELIRYAGEVGVPGDALVQCLDSGRFKALVERDLQEGRRAGISGTPTFFINGEQLQGAAPYEAFKELIEGALKGRPSK